MATLLQNAAWDHFCAGMAVIEAEVAVDAATSSKASTCTEAAAEASMTRQLQKAVDSGQHADFTNPRELMAYTRSRIKTRVRYLHALLMVDDPICAAARRLLLPSPTPTPTRVLSIGGGPGFDDVALRLLAGFLQTGGCGTKDADLDITVPSIRTLVLDLFERDWAPAVAAVVEATATAQRAGLVGRGEGSRLAHCDITLRLDSQCGANAVLGAECATADMFIFSFVLHENAVGLLRDVAVQTGEIGGVLPGLLSTAKLGAVMLCLDAGHRLWPMVAMTGRSFGWRAASPKVKRGAASVLVLERIALDDTAEVEWAAPALEQRLGEVRRHFEAHVDRDRLRPKQLAASDRGDH